MKSNLKLRAIELRKQGFTYSEILKKIPVAKSTLSLWLRSVALSKRQLQIFTEKKKAAQQRGGAARKNERILRANRIFNESRSEIESISKRELWIIGVMLYWAEGAKEKAWRTGCSVKFSNSDPRMIRIFLLWLKVCLMIKEEDLIACVYIHESWKDRRDEIMAYWAGTTGLGYNILNKIYFKRNKSSTKRRNVGDDYHGLVTITVRNSIDLNRKLAGWVEGVCLKSEKWK